MLGATMAQLITAASHHLAMYDRPLAHAHQHFSKPHSASDPQETPMRHASTAHAHQADQADLAAFEARSAAERNDALFFKQLYGAPPDAPTNGTGGVAPPSVVGAGAGGRAPGASSSSSRTGARMDKADDVQLVEPQVKQ
jgi:hypothetical protein